MKNNIKEIKDALDILGLPSFVSFKEIKKRYLNLSKKYHPDICGDNLKIVEINKSYEILKKYIENFRFTFSDEEIYKQFPEDFHSDRFRF